MKKDYDRWLKRKKEVDRKDTTPMFREGEVWWCQIGVNIGYEMFGKHQDFKRPVLVLRKYDDFTFLGIPLSTRNKVLRHWHIPIKIGGEQSNILLEQMRVYDARRLLEDQKMGNLATEIFDEVKRKLKDMLRSSGAFKKQSRKKR